MFYGDALPLGLHLSTYSFWVSLGDADFFFFCLIFNFSFFGATMSACPNGTLKGGFAASTKLLVILLFVVVIFNRRRELLHAEWSEATVAERGLRD